MTFVIRLALLVTLYFLGDAGTLLGQSLDWSAGVVYRYDAAGNIIGIGTDDHRYDDIGRLVESEANGSKRTFIYDGFGNRLDCQHEVPLGDCQPYSIASATNRIAAPVGYDAAGNVTYFSGHHFRYDALDMQSSDTTEGEWAVVMDYVYTADDERLATYTVNTKMWRWTIRDTSGKVMREFTSTDASSGSAPKWTWIKDYAYRDGLLLATWQTEPGATQPVIYHHRLDHLGTPRQVTDSQNRVIGAHTYHAFGPELTPGRIDEPSPTRLKYTGHERDGDLDYMHARFYSHGMGRFLSVDPYIDERKNLPQPQRWNRYAYVQSNPINATDPDGKDTYWINRRIGGYRASRNPWYPGTHPFIATTDGGVLQTYSWGNTPDRFTRNRWSENNPEDLVAAWEALRENGYLGSIESKGMKGTLDPYIKQAFEILKNDPASNHPNGGISNNCKTEAQRLVDVARELRKDDQAKTEEKRKKPKVKTEHDPKEHEDRP